MVSWLARGLLFVAGIVTSWFIAEDSSAFGGMQMAIGLLLLVLVVFVVAFWPVGWLRSLTRRKPN
jgi:hypothetical protein